MFSRVLSYLREFRHRRYIDGLVRQGLTLGKNVHIFDGVALDAPHCFLISIGDHSVVGANARLIAHDSSLKVGLPLARIGRIVIGERCFIGQESIILPGVTIGSNTIVGAGSVVTRDIPAGSVAAGNPARVLCSLEQFLAKHQQQATAGRIFGYGEYDIRVITQKKKAQMIAWLETGKGYIGEQSSF